MKNTMPRSPLSTPLSDSAKTTELRLKNIFSGLKKRPLVLFLALVFSVCIFCGTLIACQMAEAEPTRPDIPVDWENLAPPALTLAPVDCNKWEVLESDFFSDVGDGVLALSGQVMAYASRVLADLMREAERTAAAEVTVLPHRPDLNRNGVPEELRLYVPASWGTGQQLEIWEDGRRIYTAEGDEAHMGWNAVFLCTLEGEDYLLQYNPYMGQGAAGYNYALFTLEGGAEKVVRENELLFEVNFGMPTPDGGVVDPADIFDPDEIADFMEEINGLLAHSVQLLNTDGGLLRTFEKEGRLEDTLWFLNNEPEVFSADPQRSLRENLKNYRDAMGRAAADWGPTRLGGG